VLTEASPNAPRRRRKLPGTGGQRNPPGEYAGGGVVGEKAEIGDVVSILGGEYAGLRECG